ncbi:MAG: hypothetical protein JW908_16260 [Anaerolineales bacterium]|nr:hypothetical protein [Anaerolineales bacterium]
MPTKQGNDIWKEIERFSFLASIIILLVLAVIYWLIAQSPQPNIKLWDIARTFALDVISNLFPTFFLFALSYALIHRIQIIRDENQANVLAETIALIISEKLSMKLDNIETENNAQIGTETLSEEIKFQLGVMNEFSITQKYFDDESDPQKIVLLFTNRGTNVISVNNIKFSTNNLSRNGLLTSYQFSDGGRHFIIPFDPKNKDVLPNQSFLVEICLSQKWDKSAIIGMFGSVGYLKPVVTYKDEQLELFYTI